MSKKNYTRIRFVAYFPHGKNYAVGTFTNDTMISFIPEHLAGEWENLERIEVGTDWFQNTAEHFKTDQEFRFS